MVQSMSVDTILEACSANKVAVMASASRQRRANAVVFRFHFHRLQKEIDAAFAVRGLPHQIPTY